MVITIDAMVDTDTKFVERVEERLNCPVRRFSISPGRHYVHIDFVATVWNVF